MILLSHRHSGMLTVRDCGGGFGAYDAYSNHKCVPVSTYLIHDNDIIMHSGLTTGK
jgi:hypothetical protein